MDRAEIKATAGSASTASNILWFASSNLFRQVMNIGIALLRPLLLKPELFGLFSVMRLIPTYAHHVHLGARNTLRYRIPLHEQHGETEQTDRLRATVLTGAMTLTVLVSLALVLTAALLDARTEVRVGLIICAATVLVLGLYDHVLAELKGFQLFRIVSVQNYVSAVVTLAVGAALIWWFGFYGALATELVVFLVLLVFLARKGFVRTRWRMDLSLFKSAVLFGAPTLLFDVSLLLMRTMDRIVIAAMLGLEQLGYYALGAVVLAYVMHVPGATREVMEAKLFQHGRTEDLQVRFERYVMQPIRIIAFAMPVLIGPAVILLPAAIHLALPDYALGVPAMQALMLGGFFLAISFPLRGILVASGRQIRAAGVLLTSILLHTALSAGLIAAGFGIVGVAVSAGIAFLSAGAGLLALVVGALPERPVNLARSVILSLLPFPVMLTALALAHHVAAAATQPLPLQLVIQLGVYGLVIGVAGLIAMHQGVVPAPRGLAKGLRRRRPAPSV